MEARSLLWIQAAQLEARSLLWVQAAQLEARSLAWTPLRAAAISPVRNAKEKIVLDPSRQTQKSPRQKREKGKARGRRQVRENERVRNLVAVESQWIYMEGVGDSDTARLAGHGVRE